MTMTMKIRLKQNDEIIIIDKLLFDDEGQVWKAVAGDQFYFQSEFDLVIGVLKK